MALPRAIEDVWVAMQRVRADVLREVDGLSQAQADWRPAAGEWSIGEILHHLTVAETHTGKLTTKLVREAEANGDVAPYPEDLAKVESLPGVDPGPVQAPEVVWPEHGRPVPQLLGEMTSVRERSRGSVEKIAALDPRRLVFKHFRFGDLNIAQWWLLQAQHDGVHLQQIRGVKASPGFPAA